MALPSTQVQSGDQAVQKARQWIGTPYCWGGGHAGPVPIGTCVDCSGLVNQVYGTTGTTFTQVKLGTSVTSINQAGPGDLIFFGPLAQGEPHHVGIYVGGGAMIDAPQTGTKVRQESIQGFGPINAIRRLLPTGSGTGDTGTTDVPTQFNYAQLEGIWIMAGGSQQTAAWAAAIAMAESGGRVQASNSNSNGSVDRGLWQINTVHGAQSSFDIMTNARAAVDISNKGNDWRPWCTSYSDAACGSRGGCYSTPFDAGCRGAPYEKFYNPSITPDMNVPINGTNAVSGTTDGTDATLVKCSPLQWALFPLPCGAQKGASVAEQQAVNMMKAFLGIILNPVINVVAGSAGILAGGTMMTIGFWVLVFKTRTGRAVIGTGAAVGLTAAGFPEAGAAIGAAPRPVRRQVQARAGQARFAERSQIIGARQVEQQRAMAARTAAGQAGRVYVAGETERARTVGQRERLRQTTEEQLRREEAVYTRRAERGRRGIPRSTYSGPKGRR